MTGLILQGIPFYSRKQTGLLVSVLMMIVTAHSSEQASGESWVLQRPSLTTRAIRTVKFVTPSTGWAGGRRCIFCSRDSGNTWHEQRNPCDDFVTSFFFHDTLNGWATGYNGCLLRTTDGGNYWETQSVPTTRKISKILFLNEAKGWIISGGKDNNLFETNDSGRTWVPQSLPWKKYDESASYYAANDLVFVNYSTGITVCREELFRTTNGGVTWAGVDLSNIPVQISPYYKITMVNDAIGYLIGWFGIAKTIDGGISWKIQISKPAGGPDFGGFNCLNADTAYAFYGWDPMYFFKTVDGGATWSYASSNIQSPIMEVSGTSWNSAIAVGENGAIYKIHGALDSMSEVTSGTGADLGCVDFSESRYGCAGKRWGAGNILLSNDGGKSWYEKPVYLDSLQPVTLSTVLRFDAATIYAGGYTSGSIYMSVVSIDTGKTWKDVACPGAEYGPMFVGRIPHTQYGAYAINVKYELLATEDIRLGQWEKRTFTGSLQSPLHVYNKDTAWLRTGSSVFFTRDGARTWDTLCTGCTEDDNGYNATAIFFVTPIVGWIGGIAGTMEKRKAIFFRTEDGGKTWTKQENITLLPDPAIPPPRTLIGILKIRAISTTEAWALDTRGLLHTTDGGNTWVECVLPQIPLVLYDMYCDTTSRWVVGQASGIWKQGKEIEWPESSHSQVHFRPGTVGFNTWVHGELIVFELASVKPVTFHVMTIAGRTATKFTISAKSGKNTVRIKDIPIPAGVYCYSVSIDGGKEHSSGRFVKFRR